MGERVSPSRVEGLNRLKPFTLEECCCWRTGRWGKFESRGLVGAEPDGEASTDIGAAERLFRRRENILVLCQRREVMLAVKHTRARVCVGGRVRS